VSKLIPIEAWAMFAHEWETAKDDNLGDLVAAALSIG
jgi:hypothetical protein